MKRSLLLGLLVSLAFAAPASARCDNLDPAVCLQPFPNNYFTKSADTATGRKVNFSITDMPRNAAGKPIQPEEWNRNDGFSPGSLITTYVPGLDLAKTHGVPINDLARYGDPDAAVVVIDAKTLERNLIWTEMDSGASSDSVRNLIVRPAKNFREGHTYIVALRNLKDKDGSTIPAGDPFRGYRDGSTNDARSDHMDWVFGRLKKAGIGRSNLFLAWDFTVASEDNLTERMLHIRNDAFAQLGDTNLKDMKIAGRAPEFKVAKVEPSDGLARKVTGYFKVPCYIATPACQPGGGFVYRPGTNEPLQLPGNTYTAKFVCNVPDVALQTPGTASLYGHGLFGSTGELGQGQLLAFGREHDYVFCGTTWAGMGCELDTPPQDPAQFLTDLQAGSTDTPNCDIPNVVTAIGDLSRFNTMIDRVQEGMLAFLYLGRLMAHPQGLVTDPAFQNAQGQPVIKTGRTYYDGNSQGGIIGGSFAALMVDGDRASIGVPGMNYSTLLQRSTDFGRGTDDECTRAAGGDLPSYACLVYKAYPSEADRQVVLALMQMLWDRGEADGYAWHMTSDPLDNTPRHQVLMSLGFGDHQVSNWAAAVEARTIGARLRTPTLDTFRDPSGGYQYFGEIPAIASYPYAGSAITVWDSGPIRDNCTKGTAAPLFVNLPVFGDCPAGEPQDEWGGHDPHEEPRNTVANRAMKAAFLREGGVVTDQCAAQPCHSRGWMGAQ
ncbi:MAG TPA: hypothetical protein VF066_02660 [Thermoleophilaceae bacterium]